MTTEVGITVNGTYYHVRDLDGTGPHRHRATFARRRIVGPWSECLRTDRCTSAAHGGHEVLDICVCGATRRGNVARRAGRVITEYERWSPPAPIEPLELGQGVLLGGT